MKNDGELSYILFEQLSSDAGSLSRLSGRNSVPFLKLVGKIITVVEAAGISYVADGFSRLVHQDIFRSLQTVESQVFVEAECRTLFENSAQMIFAHKHM